MANTLTPILGKILSRGLPVLRHAAYMTLLVNTDYSTEAKRQGQTIDVEIPSDATTANVTPAVTAPTPANSVETVVQIALSNWKHSDFFLTDKELGEIDSVDGYLPRKVEAAIKALAFDINASIWAKYKGVFGYVGTAGTALFNGTDADIRNARKVLNQQLCPKDVELRRLVLDHVAEANALGVASLANLEQTGDPKVKIRGELGTKFGMRIFADDQPPTHTAGTGSGYLVNVGGGYAVGSTAITVDTGSGTILQGDIVTFAGHTQTYAVTSALASNVFSIYPPLQAIVADNAAVTLKATHTVNMAFHRDAFALAVRPLQDLTRKMRIPGEMLGSLTMIDDVTGLPLRLEVLRQYKQIVWDFDILWGTELIRPEMATRVVY